MDFELPENDRQTLHARLMEFEANWSPTRLDEALADLPPAGQPLRAALLLALARIDLARRWRAGEKVPSEHYLERIAELAAVAEAPLELAKAEYEVRRELGDPITPQQVAVRIPEHAGKFLAWTLQHSLISGSREAN